MHLSTAEIAEAAANQSSCRPYLSVSDVQSNWVVSDAANAIASKVAVVAFVLLSSPADLCAFFTVTVICVQLCLSQNLLSAMSVLTQSRGGLISQSLPWWFDQESKVISTYCHACVYSSAALKTYLTGLKATGMIVISWPRRVVETECLYRSNLQIIMKYSEFNFPASA